MFIVYLYIQYVYPYNIYNIYKQAGTTFLWATWVYNRGLTEAKGTLTNIPVVYVCFERDLI